ncbi:MAG TPA: aminotransferase class III-fold pyridoxal phosphate-dependent enzyme [Kofleriaceae bacterium]|nr:aminotransferase class III-fold pyridoxal phosphate-dependent enzyme [Kofleriaceae bacterium]
MIDEPPSFDRARVEALARELLGHTATVTGLPSERDQNFLLCVDGEPRFVMKLANSGEDRAFLVAEQRAMQHVAERCARTPRVQRLADGTTLAQVTAPDGRSHLAWAVTVMPGEPLGTLSYRAPALWHELGAAIAELTRAFEGFDDPALHREFHWDLARGRGVIARHRPLIPDPSLGAAIDHVVAQFDAHTPPVLLGLATSVIHGDLSDYNVLVGGGADLFDRRQHVTGIVDFGDMVHGLTIGDLAIAIAYAMLDAADPLSVMWQIVRGYHAVRPLTEPEMQALFGLATLRLCMSACIAAHQQRLYPGNDYLGISQAPLARTLPRLARVPFGVAAATVRSACGHEPIASSAAVRAWLAARTHTFAPVLGAELAAAPPLVLDLGIASPLVHGDPQGNDEPAFTERVFAAMRASGARVAVGRYDEPRLLYTTPAFAAGDGTLAEHRTIHLGLDLFAEAGTPVHAPLDGTVHAADEHAIRLDYGGVIMLRHETSEGVPFYTLYGHLSRASFAHLQIGQRVARGEPIARLGRPDENGGWSPHLHLQLITDLLGLGSDFPGVATPTRRDVWRSVSPDPNLLVGIPDDPLAAPTRPVTETLARRRALIGPSLRVAYRRPLRIVRGFRQYLYDDDGHRYLDAYNNVPHVGHCHPRVVRAAADQMSVLSTNTRYLHDALEDYAERLTATLPDPLAVCFFLSSASEASELAIRLARAATGRRDLVVLEAAYHGNTTTLIDASPYKHAGPGGAGAPDWVHTAPLPDDYRGPYKRSDPAAGAKYAADAARVIAGLAAQGRELAAFLSESCPSVGGQIVPPAGYLAGVYPAVRAAGGVCIADEVQTGLGRIGSQFWAFEAQGVVPDIVILGKPLGNGHPLAAVVTTRMIADAFDRGMEYFSTFGGNTVSCAVGSAVLDVVRDEALQAHAAAVGDRLLRDLRALAGRHELIGDVRGAGLFLGVELVADRATLAPAAAEADYAVNRMRDLGVLVGTDGPLHNVIKIRPPMPFDRADAAQLVATLDRVLEELS